MAAGVEGGKGFPCYRTCILPRGFPALSTIPATQNWYAEFRKSIVVFCSAAAQPALEAIAGIQLFMQIQYSRLLFGRLSFSPFGCFFLNHLIYEG